MRVFSCKSAILALGLLTAAGFTPMSSSPAAWAQSNISGDISGTVVDASGAVVTRAKVTLKSTDTGSSSEATTSDSGSYRFPLLKPGRYSITVEAAGFQSSTINVVVATGQITQGDVRL